VILSVGQADSSRRCVQPALQDSTRLDAPRNIQRSNQGAVRGFLSSPCMDRDVRTTRACTLSIQPASTRSLQPSTQAIGRARAREHRSLAHRRARPLLRPRPSPSRDPSSRARGDAYRARLAFMSSTRTATGEPFPIPSRTTVFFGGGKVSSTIPIWSDSPSARPSRRASCSSGGIYRRCFTCSTTASNAAFLAQRSWTSTGSAGIGSKCSSSF
jgi:hypothetical protein